MLPPQAVNCCLKGCENLNLDAQFEEEDMHNATFMSPQNMQVFEQLFQSNYGNVPPTGTFLPNPAWSEGEEVENVPPYLVSLTVQVDVNQFVKRAKLMQPYNPQASRSKSTSNCHDNSNQNMLTLCNKDGMLVTEKNLFDMEIASLQDRPKTAATKLSPTGIGIRQLIRDMLIIIL